MKREDYQKEILEQVGADYKTVCGDCGEKSGITHAIIDHATNTVKMVCNDCYFKNYVCEASNEPN